MVAGYGTAPAWRRWSLGLMVLGLGWYSVASPGAARPPRPANPGTATDSACRPPTDRAALLRGVAAALLRHPCRRTRDDQPLPDASLGHPAAVPVSRFEADTPWYFVAVEIFSGSVARLRRENRYPVLLLLGSERPSDRQPVTLWQRLRNIGPGHTIVVYQIHPGGMVEVGDPACGRVEWSVKDLHQLLDRRGPEAGAAGLNFMPPGAVRVTSPAGSGSGRPASRSPAVHDPRTADGRPPAATPASPSARP